MVPTCPLFRGSAAVLGSLFTVFYPLEKAIWVDFGKRLERNKRARTDKGCYPSIALNDNDTVMEVNHQTATNLMFYRVGERKDGFITWGSKDPTKNPRKRYYGSGAYPRVSINNDNSVVEVRKGQYLDRCYYRVGKVDTSTKKVIWESSIFLNAGLRPDVALNNSNTIVVLFQDNAFIKRLSYRVGELSRVKNEVTWTRKKQGVGVIAELFSFDINDSGMAVLSFQIPLKNHIHYRVGAVNTSRGVIEWCRTVHVSVGFTPNVSINNHNQVLQIHQSLMKRHLVSNVGTARWTDDFKGVDWSSERNSLNHHYGKGVYPSVALNNHGKVVEVHEPRVAPSRNRLHYYVGEIKSN